MQTIMESRCFGVKIRHLANEQSPPRTPPMGCCDFEHLRSPGRQVLENGDRGYLSAHTTNTILKAIPLRADLGKPVPGQAAGDRRNVEKKSLFDLRR